MAIKSILAEFGNHGEHGKVHLGGAEALNLLGSTSATVSIPESWAGKLKDFMRCQKGDTFSLGGVDIVRTGYYVKAKGMTFTETEHGDKGPAYWELASHAVTHSKTALAAKMRSVLAKPTTPCDEWTATLIAAMFLSEVARNPRSFMINLMLLDLIEGGVKYGKNASKELDFVKLLQFDERGGPKVGTYIYGDQVCKVGRGGAAGTNRGGKLPMSHLGAKEQYETSLSGTFKEEGTLAERQAQSTLNLQAPDLGDYHFPNALLEKECTVLLKWLVARFAKKKPLFQIGDEEVEMKGAWGGAATKLKQPIHAPVRLLMLREHLRDPAWTRATANTKGNTPAGVLVSATKNEIHSRQSNVNNLLA